MLLLAGVGIAALLTAAALRWHDAPYLAYERGDIRGALDGLTEKAAAGDGFAAYLVARAHHRGAADGSTSRTAAAWYMQAARAGEIRAVAGYLELVLAHKTSNESCEKVIDLLELSARTGALGAITTLGNIYHTERCGEKDLVGAASYYAAAARIDRRMRPFLDAVQDELSEDERARVKAVPSEFDLGPHRVLARFVSEAPALLPDSSR